MRAPRSSRALRSPRTHRMASTRLLLPEPLGPTTAVIPGSKSSSVFLAKVLKPWTSTDFRCMLRAPRACAYTRRSRVGDHCGIMASMSAMGQYAGSATNNNTTSCISRALTDPGTGGLECRYRRPRRRLLGRPARASLTLAKAHPSEPHLDHVSTVVTGTRGGYDLVYRHSHGVGLGQLLEPALVVDGAIGGGAADIFENLGCLVHPKVEVNRPDDGLPGVGQQAVEVPTTGLLNTLAHAQVIAQVEAAGGCGQRSGAGEGGAAHGQRALPCPGIITVEHVGGDQLDDSVAKKLQPLVVGHPVAGVLMRKRAVGERLQEEFGVVKLNIEAPLQRPEARGRAGHQEVIPSFSCPYSQAWPTVVIFSASSSEISIPYSSSKAMISSTRSSESALRSSTKDASGVTCSAPTPS